MNGGPLLCIDTSNPVGSLAVCGGTGPTLSRRLDTPRAHTERLFTAARELLAEAGLTAGQLGGIAVAAGPGSFTGLRIAVSTAKTLAWALKLPLYAVGSLEALAGRALEGQDRPVCALFEAGHEELYAACYERAGEDRLRALLEPRALAPEALARALESLPRAVALVGSGYRRRREFFLERMGNRATGLPEELDHPEAAVIGRLALADPDRCRVADPFSFEPDYLRVGQADLRLMAP